ncbi:MAG: hypothetical protein ABFD82_03140 [Syntrophaceae bacterium]
MKISGILRPLVVYIALLIIVPAMAMAQARPDSGTHAKPDPRVIFHELLRPYQTLNDYTVTIQAKVTMQALRIPDFTATLYFKKPDKFHIETRNFAPIPRNSGVFNPFQFDPEKNRIAYEHSENLDGTRAEVFRVEPRQSDSRIRFYYIWIGGSPKRILQMENHSYKGTKMLVRPSYKYVQQGIEKWLLPEKIHVHLTFPEGVRSPDSTSFSVKETPFSRGLSGGDEMPGEGDVYISYGEWRINTGLDDRLFQKNQRR